MGLDQYLYARRYLSGYKFVPESQQQDYSLLKAIDPIMNSMADPDTPSGEIQMTVAYWRKSNQIHKWFVDKVQGGVDECQRSATFDREVLIELRDLCMQAIVDKDSSLLPTQGGFFFGSTDIDEYYWADLQSTVDRLTVIIDATRNHPHEYAFQYQSSW